MDNNNQLASSHAEKLHYICNSQSAVDLEKQQQQPELQAKHHQLSKKQKKKIQKKQKWMELKQKIRTQKRKKQKQKRMKKQQQEKKTQMEKSHNQETQKKQQLSQEMYTRKRKLDYQDKMLKGACLVIDFQFYQEMTEKERHSLVKQLSYCHSINRKHPKSFKLTLSSLSETAWEDLSKLYNANKWGIRTHKESLLELFPREKIVYLTGDASQVLSQLQEDCIYVIGGIVDHNRLKRITMNFATQKNIRTCRLPLEIVKIKSSVHLAVNHIFEWMLRKYNGQSWDEALESVLPQRKLDKAIQFQNHTNLIDKEQT